MEGGGNGGGGGSHSREYCLRWNNHQPNMVTFLSALLPKESFADVTLVSAEGTRIQAHRIILSACSPYFEGVFESNPCKHPVVILKDVQYVDLRAIVSFIYNGEVNIEVDRINEIIQTATALQVKGLAEVPADEFKRVSLAGRCSSPAESNSPVPRSQAPPPLIMSSTGRNWQSSAESSENINDFPARKKLKKSASANIPFSSGSSSTNGDVTNSTGSSFESGVGTSVSRSVDEGIGSDISSNDQSARPGPPPLTAANANLPKSRSLDDGYQRKIANADAGSESGGYSDQPGMDDNGLHEASQFIDSEQDYSEDELRNSWALQQEGYEDLVVNGSVKMEGAHHALSYVEDDVDEEEAEMYYDEEDQLEPYDGSPEVYNQSSNHISGGFERPIAPLRKLLPKGKINRQSNNNNNNNNNNNATRAMAGVGHSLSLYRHQPAQRNFPSRAVIGKQRRRGRQLLRQHRIKRLDHESSPGGGRDDDEQGYSSDTGETCFNTKTSSSPSCYDPQQQQRYHHQARSASVEHEMYSTTSSAIIPSVRSHSPSPSSTQIKPTVPIVRVSQCSPTPPGSPQQVSSPKPEEGNNNGGEQSHLQHALLHRQSSLSGSSSSVVSGVPPGSSTGSATLLTVPVVGEPGGSCSSPSPISTVRLAGSPLHHHGQGHLVKQVSQPLPLSHHHHHHSSEDESGPSPSTSNNNPHIRRQHSHPVQSSTRAYPSYSIVGKGQLFHILKSDQFVRDEESAAYFVETTPMIQLVPAPPECAPSASVTVKDVSSVTSSSSTTSATTHHQSPAESSSSSMSITLKEIGSMKTESLGGASSRPNSPKAYTSQHSTAVSTITKDSSKSTESFSSMRTTSALSPDGQLVHRSGHCPALRPGPALGCNFCWNSVDSCGRVLRRKTKYFCPECHINLCIVPCFQEYHEKSDRKKKCRTKLGLPKPSSM